MKKITYEDIRYWYLHDNWKQSQVENAVKKGYITREQADELYRDKDNN